MEYDDGDSEQDVARGYQLLEERDYAVRQGESYQFTPKFYDTYSVALQIEKKDPKGRDTKQIGIAALVTTLLFSGSASSEDTQLMVNSFKAITRARG